MRLGAPRRMGDCWGRKMSLVPFKDLMKEAERGGYAVGYFESWNLESLQAVTDAAEAMRSPVMLGFSGIYLPHPSRQARETLSIYAALGTEACRMLSVPSDHRSDSRNPKNFTAAATKRTLTAVPHAPRAHPGA